jgi:NarL family two-component system response regulator LiaR
MIRVLLVDDHRMVREGLKVYLALEDGIEVVGEASDGGEGARLAGELKPDVVLMDLMMPGVGGVEGTKLVLAAQPGARVIILTSMPDDEQVLPAIGAGALSYLLKDVAADDLVRAIRQAAEGRPTLHPVAAQRMMAELHPARRKANPVDKLSPRELEVLQLIAKGRANKEIGEKLYIAERTVKSHVSHLLEKLELQDRTQLAIWAVQNKIV